MQTHKTVHHVGKGAQGQLGPQDSYSAGRDLPVNSAAALLNCLASTGQLSRAPKAFLSFPQGNAGKEMKPLLEDSLNFFSMASPEALQPKGT